MQKLSAAHTERAVSGCVLHIVVCAYAFALTFLLCSRRALGFHGHIGRPGLPAVWPWLTNRAMVSNHFGKNKSKLSLVP